MKLERAPHCSFNLPLAETFNVGVYLKDVDVEEMLTQNNSDMIKVVSLYKYFKSSTQKNVNAALFYHHFIDL